LNCTEYLSAPNGTELLSDCRFLSHSFKVVRGLSLDCSSTNIWRRNMMKKIETKFTILTINDIYELLPGYDGRGGLAELQTLIEQEKKTSRYSIVTVNGDFLAASYLAQIYRGKHMIDILNTMQIDYVVPGNHEFDFGAATTIERIAESNFEWLCCNVFEKDTNAILRGCKLTKVITVDEIKIGLFGLCTQETTHLSFPGPNVIFRPIREAAQLALEELRKEDVDVVIALTHLSVSEDIELAKAFPQIHVILGGHEHTPITLVQGETLIHKSGQNAYYLGRVDLDIHKINEATWGDTISHSKTVSVFPQWKMILNRGVKQHEGLHAKVSSYCSEVPAEFNTVVGWTETELDSRTEFVRCQETTMGNLVADIMVEMYNADLALLNAGVIRGDRVYPPKTPLTRSDIVREFPFPNGVVLCSIKGSSLLEAIEQGLATAGKKLGAFPHFSSGVKIVYSSQLPPNNRIVSATLHGEPIDPSKTYKLVITEYLQKGGDGYSALQKSVIEPHKRNGQYIGSLVLEYLTLKKKVAPRVEQRLVDILTTKNCSVSHQVNNITQNQNCLLDI
jgi:5'-nucleotidase/UDP-sugar diphosphatase